MRGGVDEKRLADGLRRLETHPKLDVESDRFSSPNAGTSSRGLQDFSLETTTTTTTASRMRIVVGHNQHVRSFCSTVESDSQGNTYQRSSRTVAAPGLTMVAESAAIATRPGIKIDPCNIRPVQAACQSLAKPEYAQADLSTVARSASLTSRLRDQEDGGLHISMMHHQLRSRLVRGR